MKSLSEWIFDYGFLPLIHEAVKQDFLSWYYEGSKSEVVISGLAVDNSRLSDLAQNARVEAENFDENNQLSQLVSLFEEWKSRIEMQFYYIAGILMALGAGTSAVGVLQVKDSLFSAVVEILGGALLIGGVTLVITYKILQQRRTLI